METKFYKADDLCSLLAISKSSLYRMIRHGEFPNRLKIGPRKSRWTHSSVAAYIESLQQR